MTTRVLTGITTSGAPSGQLSGAIVRYQASEQPGVDAFSSYSRPYALVKTTEDPAAWRGPGWKSLAAWLAADWTRTG